MSFRQRIVSRRITARGETLTGDRNQLRVDDCYIVGNGNTIIGNDNIIIGIRNICRGLRNWAEDTVNNDIREVDVHNVPDMDTFIGSMMSQLMPNVTITTSFPSSVDPIDAVLQYSFETAPSTARSPIVSKETRKSQQGNKRLRPENDEEGENEGRCVVCFINKICTIYTDCNHVCCCASCASLSDVCPICATPHNGNIQQIIYAGRKCISSRTEAATSKTGASASPAKKRIKKQ